MELKNSFQYGKVSLAVHTQKDQLQFVLKSGHRLHGHTPVVEHATVELLGQ